MNDRDTILKAHEWVEERLSDYMDNRLDPLERVRLERHLQDCPRCQRSLDSLRWTISLLKQAPKPALPRQFTLPVPKRASRAPVMGMSLLRLATAVATLILVSLIGVDLITNLGGGGPAAMAPAARSLDGNAPMAATRAALALASPTRSSKSAVPAVVPPTIVASQPPAVAPAAATAAPSPTLSPAPTSAPAAASGPAATSAPPAGKVAPTTTLPPRLFAQPSAGTRSGATAPPTETPLPTMGIYGLGGGSLPTESSEAAQSSLQASPATPAPTMTVEPTQTPLPPTSTAVAPSATPTPHVEALVQATHAPAVAPPPAPDELLTPLRAAELGTLFIAVFLGAILAILRLRS